jgi:tetrahydromethanopterin S-methyltransferase subunit F
MFLTVHSAVGLAASNYIHQPILGFIIGFILHYVFDIIPHGDTKVSKKYHNVIYMTLAGLIDLAILSSTFIVIMLTKNKFFNWVQILTICGSVLPDALLFFQFIWPQNKFLLRMKKLHHYIHNQLVNKFGLGLIPGMILQIILFIIALTIFF